MPNNIGCMRVPGHHQYLGVLLYGITTRLDDLEIDDMRNQDRLLADGMIEAEQVELTQVKAAPGREAGTFAQDEPRF